MMKEVQEADRQSHRTDRDGFNKNGRSWTRDDKKWDHGLFEDANEEEQVAKVEALLAS